MAIEGYTKVRRINTTTKSRSITIPFEVYTDSTFPFEDDEKLKISIVDKKLILEKYE
jgi:hypothetical protein